jgi:hypothetical protein
MWATAFPGLARSVKSLNTIVALSASPLRLATPLRTAVSVMLEAPSKPEPDQLEELGLRFVGMEPKTGPTT